MLGKIPFIERLVDAGGQKSIVLTATEYPYGNYQVLPWDDTNRERILSALNPHETIGRIDGREDFGVIIIGSSVKLDATQQSCSAVANAIMGACSQAAAWWHDHHPAPVDYNHLDIPVVEGSELLKHPTYKGEEPVPIPEDYFEEWKKEHPYHDPYAHLRKQS